MPTTCANCRFFKSGPLDIGGICCHDRPVPQMVQDIAPPGLAGGPPQTVMRKYMLETEVRADRPSCHDFQRGYPDDGAI